MKCKPKKEKMRPHRLPNHTWTALKNFAKHRFPIPGLCIFRGSKKRFKLTKIFAGQLYYVEIQVKDQEKGQYSLLIYLVNFFSS